MEETVYWKIREGSYTPKMLWSKETRQAYAKERGRLEQEFKEDLLEENGVTDNPKADLCYQKAWEIGHHGGLSEVEIVFSDLVELIQE